MNGWVQKAAVLENSKSLAIRGWLKDFNVGVPCNVQVTKRYGDLKPGRVYVEMQAPLGLKYRVQVFPENVYVEHPWFKHSIRLTMLPQALEVMHGSSS